MTGSRLLNDSEQERCEAAARAFLAALAQITEDERSLSTPEGIGDLAGLAVQAVIMAGVRQFDRPLRGNALAGACAGVMAGGACAVRGMMHPDDHPGMYRLMGDAFSEAASVNEQLERPKGSA